jgi:FKBP-type peptidyl-prolyl cis-trans isomerase (trigger factor)
MVGFKPITRYEVSKELFKQGGKAVVDDLITRKLINGEIKKNNIEVTPAEIDAKVEEIKSTLGESGNLEDVLAANGTNLADFRKQLELRIGIEKLLSDRIAVSETELDAYLSQNKSLMTSATDEAKRKEASDMLKVSKLQTEANKWVEELKSKARIWTAPGI